jgi:hypothetical protein
MADKEHGMSNIDFKPNLVNEVLDFLVSSPTPEQIVALKLSAEAQERVHYLLDQNRNGGLTVEEKNELDEYMNLDYFMTLLKAHAHKKSA